ncbi:hypothetical protein Btru_034598 [Bulinus truncatus]|nr:hypothetical protein Btru_034598 [Bulinus truncatus]
MAEVAVTPREMIIKMSQPADFNYRSADVCRTFVGESVTDRSSNPHSKYVLKGSQAKTVPVKLIAVIAAVLVGYFNHLAVIAAVLVGYFNHLAVIAAVLVGYFNHLAVIAAVLMGYFSHLAVIAAVLMGYFNHLAVIAAVLTAISTT